MLQAKIYLSEQLMPVLSLLDLQTHKKKKQNSVKTNVITTTKTATAIQNTKLTLTEAVLEAPLHLLQVPHSAGPSGLPADGFHAPVICRKHANHRQ